MIDYHSHILPGIDDGSKSVEMTKEMLLMLQEQGVDTVFATPHFNRNNESVRHFIARRNEAYEKIKSIIPEGMKVLLGAEVAYIIGLSEIEDFELLKLENTDYFLIELPFGSASDKVFDDIYNVACISSLAPVFAHVERFDSFYNGMMEKALTYIDGAVLQFSTDAFGSMKTRHQFKRMLGNGFPVVFGSDAHNLDKRAPEFDKCVKKLEKMVGKEFAEVILNDRGILN